MCACAGRLLFECVGLAHDDRRSGRAEARHHFPNPLRGRFAEPAAMLPAVGAGEFADMWLACRADGADIAAARPLAIDGTIEFQLKADQGRGAEQISAHSRPPRSTDGPLARRRSETTGANAANA